jgi:hypothetical protein
LLSHTNDTTELADVFAGLDWGETFHQLCLIDSTGTVLLQRRIMHDVAGLAELDVVLSEFASGLRACPGTGSHIDSSSQVDGVPG